MENDFRICAACGARVQRWQVHKNRYSQYICRECRSSGVKAVGPQSIRALAARTPVVVLVAAGILVVLVLLVGLLVLASSLHDYSNGGMIEDLKGIVRSLNQLVR